MCGSSSERSAIPKRQGQLLINAVKVSHPDSLTPISGSYNRIYVGEVPNSGTGDPGFFGELDEEAI